MNDMKISDYKPFQRGALCAFFTVELPSGMLVHEVKLFSKEGRRWVGLPSREFVGRDGTKSYAPVLEFTNREASDRFREGILRAIDEQRLATQPAPAKAQIPSNDPDDPNWEPPF